LIGKGRDQKPGPKEQNRRNKQKTGGDLCQGGNGDQDTTEKRQEKKRSEIALRTKRKTRQKDEEKLIETKTRGERDCRVKYMKKFGFSANSLKQSKYPDKARSAERRVPKGKTPKGQKTGLQTPKAASTALKGKPGKSWRGGEPSAGLKDDDKKPRHGRQMVKKTKYS